MRNISCSLRLATWLSLFLFLAACGPKAVIVSTVAGSERGYADGKGTAALFDSPADVAVDSQGNLYIADGANHLVRKITPDGTVTTLAGAKNPGYVDAMGAEARFSTPTGIVVSSNGLIYVADSVEMDPHPMHVRQVTAEGQVTTLAGGSRDGSKDGTGKEAFFRTPANLAVGPDGRVYVADTNNHRIRVITPDGQVSTLAGKQEAGSMPGYEDGSATQALFREPRGLTVDSAGNVYVADTGNHCIRKITPDGQVTTLAGSPEPGYADGKGAEARFNYPADVAVDAQGNVFVADSANHRIRQVSPDGTVTTVAGNGQPGFQDGPAAEAQFRLPEGIAIDDKGNLYVADTANHCIRKISR